MTLYSQQNMKISLAYAQGGIGLTSSPGLLADVKNTRDHVLQAPTGESGESIDEINAA